MMVSKQTNNSSKSLAEISVFCRISSASGQYFSGWAILMVYFGHSHLCHDAIASVFPEACLIVCMHLLPCLIFRMLSLLDKGTFLFCVHTESCTEGSWSVTKALRYWENAKENFRQELRNTPAHRFTCSILWAKVYLQTEIFLLASDVKLSVHTSSDYVRELCWISRTGFFKKEAV